MTNMTEQSTEQMTGSAHEGRQRLPPKRANAALRTLFIDDALAMPVHGYYNPQNIDQAFPGGIRKLEAAPRYHPSSIMALHSTLQGGREPQASGSSTRGEGRDDPNRFIEAYIAFTTADEPQHPDTYAESSHCAFFANSIRMPS
jgi:hypothetical protein